MATKSWREIYQDRYEFYLSQGHSFDDARDYAREDTDAPEGEV